MRWFALGILLVINLVLLLWQLLVHQPEQARPAILPDIGELRLLSELEPPGARDAQVLESDTGVVEEPVVVESEAASPEGPAEEVAAVPLSPVVEDPLVAVDRVASQVLPDTDSFETGETALTEPETMPLESVGMPAEEPALEPLVEQEPAVERELANLPEETQVPEEAAGSAEVAGAGPEMACWRLGPFDSEDEANELAVRLPEEMAKLKLETVGVKIPNGYYVLIPPLVDRDEALAVERRLKREGVEDSWVFTSGPLKNAVSLGLFNREINARRRVREVEAKGFQPELRPRFRHGEKALLLVIGPEGKQSEDALGQLGGGDPEPIPCP